MIERRFPRGEVRFLSVVLAAIYALDNDAPIDDSSAVVLPSFRYGKTPAQAPLLGA